MTATTPVDLREEPEPDLLFSFQGGRTHPLRDQVLELRHPRAIVEDTSDHDFYVGNTAPAVEFREARAKYIETIRRSKFVLCPRGYGPASFRLYEVIAAGRVPVVISDEWLPPERIPWHTCSLRIPEVSAGDVVSILAAEEHRWPALMRGAQNVYETYLAAPVLWDYLVGTLEQVRAGPRGDPGGPTDESSAGGYVR